MWHGGYAELLWSHYYFMTDRSDYDLLTRIVTELKQAVTIDKNNKQANELLDEIRYSMPEVLTVNSSGYVYSILTATPVPTETLIGPPPGWEETLKATAKVTAPPAPADTAEPTVTPSKVSPSVSITSTRVPTKPVSQLTAAPTAVDEKKTSRLPFCCGGIIPLTAIGLLKVLAPKKTFSR